MQARGPQDRWYLLYHRLRSGALLALSYLWAVVLGSLLLWLPWSSETGGLSLVDALFTATSAVCVTGLTVVDTGSAFTVFGKSVILLLIQAGGLGIMTFSVLMALAIGRMPALRDRWVIESMFGGNIKIQAWDLVKSIAVFTFICEAAGAVLLCVGWLNAGYPLGEALWYGLFHSVSAFCNAGFAFFPDSFEGFRGDLVVNLTVCGLIILGGIGFLVLYELAGFFRSPINRRVSLNTRLVLWTTLVLLAAGAVGIYLLEANNALQGMPLGQKLLASFFQSATARTAGFNTVNIAYLGNATILLLMLLMFVGASPGSCGGGIRTTSLALLIAL
ncbi:MAG: ATPase, partial [Candidatus Glassbacteria bacterium]|nr:ATPase [Candidatus Glassbacteria bacterium]